MHPIGQEKWKLSCARQKAGSWSTMRRTLRRRTTKGKRMQWEEQRDQDQREEQWNGQQ